MRLLGRVLLLLLLLLSIVLLIVLLLIILILIGAPILRILHIVRILLADLNNRYLYLNTHIECLFPVRPHLNVPVHQLPPIDRERLFQQQPRLIPVRRWRSGPRLQCQVLLTSLEDRVEVQSVAVDQTCGVEAVLKEEVDLLQVLERAASLEVENETIWG